MSCTVIHWVLDCLKLLHDGVQVRLHSLVSFGELAHDKIGLCMLSSRAGNSSVECRDEVIISCFVGICS